ncbi:hypothetical protein [Nostoc sp.]|uniref:hypothetical protein n=1 Tax=Nostoc sp. TaxID=1180 RepID=UPI002FFAC53B
MTNSLFNTLGLRRKVGWVEQQQNPTSLGLCWVSFLKRQLLQLLEPPQRTGSPTYISFSF